MFAPNGKGIHPLRRLATGLAAAVLMAADPDSASAYGYNTVPCWRWDCSADYAVLKHKPRKCTLGGRYGYQRPHPYRPCPSKQRSPHQAFPANAGKPADIERAARVLLATLPAR